MKVTKAAWLLLSFGLLVGCASVKLSSHYAQFHDEPDQTHPPLLVTSRFNANMCSDYFGYIDFSIQNPTAHWQTLRNVSLYLPYAEQNAYQVVQGDRLIAWARAKEREAGRNQHNASMAYLATGALAGLMMVSNNDKVSDAGATLALASMAHGATTEIAQQKAQSENAPIEPSHHLMAEDVIIPPGMDNQFWLLLTADEAAPLLGSIGIRYEDEQGVAHTFESELANWSRCAWQQARKKYLFKTASDIAQNAKVKYREGATLVDTPRGRAAQMDEWEMELFLRQKNQHVDSIVQ